MNKLEKGQAGIAGEYAVMSQLILNGFAVGMTGGNSKEIDLLCRDVSSGKTTSIQVKTQAPDVAYIKDKANSKEVFAFFVGSRDKKDVTKIEKLKRTILDKQIYYAFYVAKNGRLFIATPEEVVKQINTAVDKSPSDWIYFRITDEESIINSKREVNYDLSVGFEGDNGWNKLRS